LLQKPQSVSAAARQQQQQQQQQGSYSACFPSTALSSLSTRLNYSGAMVKVETKSLLTRSIADSHEYSDVVTSQESDGESCDSDIGEDRSYNGDNDSEDNDEECVAQALDGYDDDAIGSTTLCRRLCHKHKIVLLSFAALALILFVAMMKSDSSDRPHKSVLSSMLSSFKSPRSNPTEVVNVGSIDDDIFVSSTENAIGVDVQPTDSSVNTLQEDAGNTISNQIVFIPHAETNVSISLSQRTQTQIENYKNGKGIMLNIHITHHGGTSVCGLLGKARNARLPAPSFACLMREKVPTHLTPEGLNPSADPWNDNETAAMIKGVLPYFHMISWEYSNRHLPRSPPLSATHWEDPNLLSIFVIREPISRMMAGDGWVSKTYPGVTGKVNGTDEEWWEFLRNKRNDNYALSILAADCCSGAATKRVHLERAKKLVKRFSFVLDIGCLDQGLEVIARLTGLEIKWPRRQKDHTHVPVKNRFYNAEMYEYAREVNKLDIELYEWARGLALVNCSAL
jgi:hypothetical protein